MTQNEFNNIKRDIASFADDEHDVICDETTGEIIFERQGIPMSITIYEDENGGKFVKYNGTNLPYKTFLAKELAHLDILAHKIHQHGQQNGFNNYVDPDVILNEQGGYNNGKGIEVLNKECSTTALVGTKICFVTADAGHGKTVLLQKFQYQQAKKYINGDGKFLFLHIDLCGRDLVRLNEAIMYELGELRVTGLYYSSILTLIRRHLIVLGIDGFDELTAEKGGEGALNSLSSLVSQMEGRGVLIAASRRAFFNSQDYVRRTGMLKKNIGDGCVFDELKLLNWRKEQCVKFLDYYTFDENDYKQLLSVLKSESHPLLERPYLFVKMVLYSYTDSITPYEFVTKGHDGLNNISELDNINDVIESFVYREVDKWRERDKITGLPYLSFEQHIRLLSEVATEMWNSQKEVISLDSIQLLLTILFDEWKIPADTQPIIIRMVESHAMLIIVDGNNNYRRFDHVEFKNFFLARALQSMLEKSVKNDDFNTIQRFLYIAQMPDSVAQYLSSRIGADIVIRIVNALLSMRRKEWKPSFLQTNIGTLIPFLLDKFKLSEELTISDKITFSSIIFENKNLQNIVFKDCSFVNISFKNTILKNIKFESCCFTCLTVFADSKNSFDNVLIQNDCSLNALSIAYENEEPECEYSPISIMSILQDIGIITESETNKIDDNQKPLSTEFYKLVKRFLNKFSKTTCLYESNVKDMPIYNLNKPNVILNEIIPLLQKYGILEERENKKTRQAGTKAWVLKNYDISEIFTAEFSCNSELHDFWEEVKNHD